MQNFKYTGINRYGKRVRGVVSANDQVDLNQKLRKQQINVISSSKQGGSLFGQSKAKVTRKELIFITFQLAQLLKAGVPLLEVLDDLKNSIESESAKEMLTEIHDLMQGGSTFSEALTTYKKVFGNVYVALVSVGENTGKLDEILTNLGEMLKWEDELASKAKKVMIYPAIVATVVIAVVILMMLFVVPELLGFITSMGGEIGLATTALIATSAFIQNYIIELFVIPIALVYLLKWWRTKSEKFTLKTDELALKISIIGPIIHKLKLARVANTLSVMYGAGISFTESMKMSSTVAGNTFLKRKIDFAVQMIQEGKPIHEAFESAEVFPKLAISMIKVGENSGQMDEALSNISYFYDREAKEMIEKIEPAIEPILTVVMGFVVGWVMIAVLGPIYDTIAQVQ